MNRQLEIPTMDITKYSVTVLPNYYANEFPSSCLDNITIKQYLFKLVPTNMELWKLTNENYTGMNIDRLDCPNFDLIVGSSAFYLLATGCLDQDKYPTVQSRFEDAAEKIEATHRVKYLLRLAEHEYIQSRHILRFKDCILPITGEFVRINQWPNIPYSDPGYQFNIRSEEFDRLTFQG